MENEPKKLVRGLKDISPLFGVVPEKPVIRRSLEVQVLGVSSPDCDGDSLLLNTFFASQIASPEKACSILSILARSAKGSMGERSGAPEPFGDNLQRYCMYWDELHDLLGASASPQPGGLLQSRDIFLDFEYRHLLHYKQVIGLLDKWVLLLKPNAESLTEGYKMMKVGLALNPQIEFYVALAGKAEETKGESVFGQFSDFATKHLDVHLEWLGWMDLADPARHFSTALHTEPLRYQSWNAKPTLPKFMLAGWIESHEKEAQPAVPTEAL